MFLFVFLCEFSCGGCVGLGWKLDLRCVVGPIACLLVASLSVCLYGARRPDSGRDFGTTTPKSRASAGLLVLIDCVEICLLMLCEYSIPM